MNIQSKAVQRRASIARQVKDMEPVSYRDAAHLRVIGVKVVYVKAFSMFYAPIEDVERMKCEREWTTFYVQDHE